MTEMSDVLARFHAALVEEILNRRPEYIHAPFTVAEIYQNLVPYGTHRDLIGVEMNGDYEDALLRLLAGEGGYLVLESPQALRTLREEVSSSNPNTGLYREFAAVDVRLNQAFLPGARRAASAAPETSAPAAEGDAVAPAEPLATPPARSREAPEACPWCRAELPRRPNLNYCPFCGTDVHVVPCPGCGAELDPEWRFCIVCGTEI
jgi:hypothetical protein